jgi:hypothetical protein
MLIHVCDMCKIQAESANNASAHLLPPDWTSITASYYPGEYLGSATITYKVCRTCRAKLCIPSNWGDGQKDIAHRLLEIIQEIVAGQDAC